jgi:hypothetical protein
MAAASSSARWSRSRSSGIGRASAPPFGIPAAILAAVYFCVAGGSIYPILRSRGVF